MSFFSLGQKGRGALVEDVGNTWTCSQTTSLLTVHDPNMQSTLLLIHVNTSKNGKVHTLFMVQHQFIKSIKAKPNIEWLHLWFISGEYDHIRADDILTKYAPLSHLHRSCINEGPTIFSIPLCD